MDINMKITVNLAPEDVKGILTPYIEQKTGKKVKDIKFNIKQHTRGSNQRDEWYEYTLEGVDITLV